MNINPLHEVRDADKVAALAADMAANGWTGRPVLVVDGEVMQAITGTHRLAAAAVAGIEPQIMVLEPAPFSGDYDAADAWDALTRGDDDERVVAMQYLHKIGEVSLAALEVMQAE